MEEPSRIDDPLDDRRVRAMIVDELELQAQREGHTLLSQGQVIRGVRERPGASVSAA